MATIEKPRQKKKKKAKERNETKEEENIGNVAIEFPSTSTRYDEILSHECFVSSEFQSIPNEDSDRFESINDINENPSIEDETRQADQLFNLQDDVENSKQDVKDSKPNTIVEKENKGNLENVEIKNVAAKLSEIPIEATAPTLEERENQTTTRILPLEPFVKYPDLANIRSDEAKTKINYDQNAIPTKNKCKPFTSHQLKEIYFCNEIESAKQFEIEFLTNSSEENFQNHVLYRLLLEYAKLRTKIKVNLMDVQNFKKRISSLEPNVWTMEKMKVQYSGTCGDNLTVSGVETYTTAVLNENILEKLSDNLSQLHELICFSHTTNLVYCKVTKLRIEQLVRKILSYPAFENINSETPIIINNNLNPSMSSCLSHLRIAVSIMFCFLRRPSPDKIFSNDVKCWLQKLVALQLRVATREDHWFLLLHILRCPSGVSLWATSIIQIPSFQSLDRPGDFLSPEINYCVSFLAILLMPIKKRNEFLSACTQYHKDISDPVKDDLWILVDSDGEEGSNSSGECIGLKESDLISFLNQVPFDMLFRSILNIEKSNESYIIPEFSITGNQLIKIIAFNSTLIELFGEGLLTYNTERYKQFAKRLGRLIRHTIQYISDYHKLYIRNNLSKDPYLCERIRVEFDNFVVKSCNYIYRARSLGTWQYFSSLPFGDLDMSTMWKLFYFLNVGFSSEFIYFDNDFQALYNRINFWDLFNSATTETSADDLYYLLQAFLGMALGRDRSSNWSFIQIICSHILNIGFINIPSREICYKTSRDMLVNITIVYPNLISDILTQLKNRLVETENILYLIRSLPIDKWQPEMENYEILSFWLLNYSYDTIESTIARIVISHLNWNFDGNDDLFLSHDIHIRMACLICESATKHVPEIVGSSGISESVRQVSNLTENQTTKEQFVTWCWTMIATLRLHSMDQSKKHIKNSLANPTILLNLIPEMEKINSIFQGVTESRPLAIYLSILISLWGHSVPLICQKGFTQLQLLLNDYRHATVIRCLQLITPLFLECPETLCQCEKFQDVIKTLLNSDRTYIKMAKDFISSNSAGPVLELFGNMIQAQIINYSEYGISSPTVLINLWLECLTRIPNWQNPNVCYLIDLILKIAYQFPDSWWSCKEYFRFLYKNLEESRTPKSSTFKLLLGSSNSNKTLPTSTSDAGWFALLNLELEHEIYELQTGLWKELLRQLRVVSGKCNMDNIVKKAASIVGCSPYQTTSLVLYKFANLITSFESNHHLLPIICQKFFTLYLARAYDENSERFHETFGVSDKFYEYNISLMKKLKARLKQTEQYYLSESQKYSGPENDAYIYFLTNCSKMFTTYLLWLEETTINKISRNQNIDLPPQYNRAKLKSILEGNDQHWTEFLYLSKIRKEQKDAAYEWLKYCVRYNSSNKPTTSSWPLKQQDSPSDRIINHLRSYDRPVSPPDIIKKPLIMQTLNAKDVDINTLTTLRNDFKVLDESAREFNFGIKEINSLNGNYKDSMRILYKNMPYTQLKFVNCSSIFSKSMLNCVKPAEIYVPMEQPQKNEPLWRKIENNRERYEKLLAQQLSQNVSKLVFSMERIEHTIRHVLLFQNESKNNETNKKQLADVSIQFFFDVINNMNDNITAFPPTNDSCNTLLSELGVFIQEYQETQGIRILKTALKRPELIKLLSELFVPSRVAPECFINLYKFLIDSHLRRCDNKILFVLLSKFDLQNWLQNFQPKLSEVSQLLKLILTGLENWNQPNTELLQDLFRRHLIHIFEHKFPEHYGEVLQIVLTGISEQKLKREVLMDVVNSLLIRSGCEKLELNSNQTKITEQITKFATQQNLFTFKSITDTVVLFAQHFQKERLQHGLHGLYPKHKDYIMPLSILFTCFGYAASVSAVYTYPGVLADQICDWIFGPIVEMYSPWLVTYSEVNLQNSTANWIKQLIANGKVLYPWSELHMDKAQFMICGFVKTLQFILDSFPVSNSILGHVLSWYEFHFAKRDIGHHLRSPVHNALILLPWDSFEPNALNIETMYKILQEYLPECHSFLGYIFLRVSWTTWIKQTFHFWNHATQTRVISILLTIFVQISFEPHVHDDQTASKILTESLQFPWHIIEYQGLENVFNWFVVSAEPSVILKLPSEVNFVDSAVLELLKHTSCMTTSGNQPAGSTTVIQAKKILYVRSIVRLLKACESKHQKLLDTKEGHLAFQTALIDLITSIDCTTSVPSNRKDSESEAQNLMIEIVGSLQTQGEFIAKIYVNAIAVWQTKCKVGSLVLATTLNAIGICKSFTNTMYSLLETTIYNYFRYSGETEEYYSPSWISVLQRLGLSLNYLDLMTLIRGPYLLSLHVYILHKLKTLENLGEKITFLQDLSQLLENVKTTEITEPRIAIIWGAIISCGCHILQNTDNAKKPLLMLARYFQNLSSQTEGWGEGLLGVIGLKRDSVSNRRKILTRCLSCFIFSLFPDTRTNELKPSQEFIISMEELRTVTASKKYADVRNLSTKAIVIVNECRNLNSQQIVDKICNIIQLLYNESFLLTIHDVWNF